MAKYIVEIKATVHKTHTVEASNAKAAEGKASKPFSVLMGSFDGDQGQEVLKVKLFQKPTLEWKAEPEVGLLTFNKAFKKFSAPDAKGWRLPTKAECDEYVEALPASDREKELRGPYWTSTTVDGYYGGHKYAWFCSFEYGIVVNVGRSNALGVRLVREVIG